MTNHHEENSNSQLPRRDFLKYSSLLSASAAAAVYLKTDSKAQTQQQSIGKLGGQSAGNYNYANA